MRAFDVQAGTMRRPWNARELQPRNTKDLVYIGNTVKFSVWCKADELLSAPTNCIEGWVIYNAAEELDELLGLLDPEEAPVRLPARLDGNPSGWRPATRPGNLASTSTARSLSPAYVNELPSALPLELPLFREESPPLPTQQTQWSSRDIQSMSRRRRSPSLEILNYNSPLRQRSITPATITPATITPAILPSESSRSDSISDILHRIRGDISITQREALGNAKSLAGWTTVVTSSDPVKSLMELDIMYGTTTIQLPDGASLAGLTAHQLRIDSLLSELKSLMPIPDHKLSRPFVFKHDE